MKSVRNKMLSLLLCTSLLLSLTACGKSGKTRHEADFLELFDTQSQIVAYMDTKQEFERMSNLIYDNLKQYHQLYDIYNDYDGINNVKTINDNAGIAPVKVDRRIIDLLKLGKAAYQLSDGDCNVALGAVLSIWHKYREAGIDDPDNARLPPMEDLQEAAKHTDINQMIIDEGASTVYLADPKMSLDVGAIAKGYATECVARLAEENGYHNALLSIGGNVRAIGGKGLDGQLWNVGVQNPDKTSEQTNLFVLLMQDESLVTSGIYERYYTVDGKNYHHLIDPHTLMPAAFFQSVTILCPDSGMADALSTSVFNMPFDQGSALIESLPDTEACWVFLDGSIKFSSGFQAYIKK